MTLEIERTPFGGWQEAYQLRLGETEMVILAEVGPRIVSLRVGRGPNLLYMDPTTLGKGQGDTTWHIYGGHRIWVSPETLDAYRPDNAPCAVDIQESKLTLITKADPDTLLRKRLTVSAQGDRFVVESAALNTSDLLYQGAIWCLTCVMPKGVIAFPWGSGGKWDVKRIQWWNSWAGHSSDVRSKQYQPSPDLFLIRPTGEEGKVGTHSPEGWIAYCREDATFIKSFQPDAWAIYPDGGCSVEVYTCAAFIEMETLTPMAILHPGQEIAQQEVWTVIPRAVDPEDGNALRALLP